jgi:hypothetical protein
LRGLLSNVTYLGQVRYKHEAHPGEHAAIVDRGTWQQVQTLLQDKRQREGVRLANGSLLHGLLRCQSCACPMIGSHTTKGTRRYRYYLCRNAQKRGWHACPAPTVPAGRMEELVIEQIRASSGAARQEFELGWQTLVPWDQARAMQQLVEQIDYDGVQGVVAIRFRQGGSAVLVEPPARPHQEKSP